MSGIYIHIPFCRNKCSYCDFYSVSSTAYLKPILGAMQKEIETQKKFFSSKKIDTIYIGGGTPSLLDVQSVENLFSAISRHWDLSSLREVTMEVNPEDVSREYLAAINRSTPINRISMGVQSFSEPLLRFMNRRHSAEKALEAFNDAREVGFDNISLDLIYAIPSQSFSQWQDTLERMIQLRPEHISAYHLSIEPRTRFGMMLKKGELAPVDEAVSERDYDLLCESLSRAGYEHYEISNFALPSYRAVHNSSYWTGEPYLGIGPGAHSFNGTERHYNQQSVKEYLKNIDYQREILSMNDKYNEFVMLSLRQRDGVNIALMGKLFSAESKKYFLEEAQKQLDRGDMSRDGDIFKIKEEKWLISDAIIAKFFI